VESIAGGVFGSLFIEPPLNPSPTITAHIDNVTKAIRPGMNLTPTLKNNKELRHRIAYQSGDKPHSKTITGQFAAH
jgi:hypothetical protein